MYWVGSIAIMSVICTVVYREGLHVTCLCGRQWNPPYTTAISPTSTSPGLTTAFCSIFFSLCLTLLSMFTNWHHRICLCFLVFLCGRCNGLHYGSCPFVRPSVCLSIFPSVSWSPNSKNTKLAQTELMPQMFLQDMRHFLTFFDVRWTWSLTLRSAKWQIRSWVQLRSGRYQVVTIPGLLTFKPSRYIIIRLIDWLNQPPRSTQPSIPLS